MKTTYVTLDKMTNHRNINILHRLSSLAMRAILVCLFAFCGVGEMWGDEWSINFSEIGARNSLADKAGASISDAVSNGMGTVTLGEALNSNFGIQTGTTWIYRTAQRALYSSNSGGRNFGVFNAIKDQIITLDISAAPTPTNATLQSENGNIRTYKVTNDGTVTFNLARYNYIYSISIEDNNATTADYTVIRKNGDVEIDRSVQNGAIGEPPSFSKDNFTKNDQRYIYVSDDAAGKTIASDGSTVITVTYREAAKYAYTVTTSYGGETLPYSTSGSVWEDEARVTVSYPRYQQRGTLLVEREPVSNNLETTIDVTSDNFVQDLAYKATIVDNLYLLSEAENLGTGLPTNGTTFTGRVSNRLIIYGASGKLCSLPAGKYKFSLGMIGGDNSSHKVNYVVSAGSQEIINAICNGNNLAIATSDEFILSEETDITFTCSDPSSSRGIDLIYVAKTGDYVSFAQQFELDKAAHAALDKVQALDADGQTAYHNAVDAIVVEETLESYNNAIAALEDAYITGVKAQTTPESDMTALVKNANCAAIDGWSISPATDSFHVNTWSTEADGTGMNTPFIEYWVAAGNTLSNATISHEQIAGLHAGYYRISGLVRVYSETGNANLTGATLNVNGESVDMCVAGTPVTFNALKGVYGNYSKVVHVNEGGDLDFNIVINGANFNWIAMKNFTLTYVGTELPSHTWDFTNWSDATKTNLEADENWSHQEKADVATQISGCYWQVTSQEGALTANGTPIAELAGLNFTNKNPRGLAIATNYSSTSLGTYHGAQYLWLGESGIDYFTIPNVKQGTKIRMGVESHKSAPQTGTADPRGVDLYVNSSKVAGPAAYPTTYQELEWTIPVDTRKQVLDVVVKNSNGCHIYWIDAEIGDLPFYDFAINLTDKSDLLTSDEKAAQGNPFNFGITADETTTTRVAVGASNAVATVTGNYYNDHGSQNVTVVTKVPGPVAIIMGTCGYGETQIKVTPEGGEPQILATHARTGSGSDCWKGNHDNVLVGYYMGEATTLTIENAGSPHYTPYIAVRQIKDLTSTPNITSTGDKAKFVTITCDDPNATIYYTTDGSEPTASSHKYDNAFAVLATTTVKAKAFAPGKLPSEVGQASIAGQSASLVSNTYYNAVVSNVDELLTALNAAPGSSRYRILVKNGTYDLKGVSLTTVKGNVSLIGESQQGVLIKNTPAHEGIGITATLLIQGQDNYLQDLQLMCDVDYDQGAGAGRGVAMQDKGTRTIAKNVSLLSNQDTYYSSGGKDQQGYFETSYITGTVDYICGGGDIWFERTTLYNNARSNGDVITAPATNAETQWGYVFNECTVDGDAGQSGKYNLGRPWQGSPAATWLNTTWKIPSSSAGYTSMGAGLKLRFHEYPVVSGHNLRNCNGSNESEALALDAAGAARYTLANVFGDWTPATYAAQIATPQIKGNDAGTEISWPAVVGAHAIAICCNGKVYDFVAPDATSYTLPQARRATDKWCIRIANEMGGLGEPCEEIEVQAAAEFNDAAMELTGETPLLGTKTITDGSPKYLHLESDGTVTVVGTEAESNAKVTTATFKDAAHGYTGFTMVVNVPGPVKIGVGQCADGGTIHVAATPIAPSSSKQRVAPIIPNDNSTIDINIAGEEYTSGSDNISYGYYNGAGAATLTITTVDASAINYLSIERIADEPIVLAITTDLNASYTTILNRAIQLKVEATGIEPSYQWYECDDAGKTNPRVVEGETSADFRFAPTTSAPRYFYCEVTDGISNVQSRAATVSVVEDNGVVVGNWRRYVLQDYQSATESDWVNRSNSVLSIETNNGRYSHQVPSGSGDRGAYFYLQPYVDQSRVQWDEWKLEWDAQLTQGNTNDRSHSAFAITNGIPGSNTAVFQNTFMYLGADMITATSDKTLWYLLPNGYINDDPADAEKVRLTNGNVNFTLNPSTWYHFKVTYNINKEVHVVISSGAAVVAEATYKSTLQIKDVTTMFSTVGRGSGVANVDNIDFSIFDNAPGFVENLPATEDVYATRRDTLKVETEGALRLQWYRCDNAEGRNAVAIPGATSEQYIYSPTEDEMGDQYFFVEASNTLGTSRSVVCNVKVTEIPPEITTIALGDFNFGANKYKVNITGVGTIKVKLDDADDFVDYSPTNTYALNSVTAKAVGKAGGESMPVTIFAPMQNDPNKPFAAWVYQPDYLNTSSKTEMEHEVQASPILQNVQTYYNIINVPLSKDDNYDQGNNTLDQAELVIMSDMVEGGSTLTKSMQGLYGIVPLINMKAYSYSSGRWDWGTPGEGDTAPVTITPVNPWLQMFEGATVADNSNAPSASDFGQPGIDMFDKQHAEWADDYKHLQWVTSPTSDAASFTTYATAIAPGNIIMHGKDGVVSMAYSEDAGRINAAQYSTAPYLLFSLNADNGLAVSDDASIVLGNIANLILRGQSFGTVSRIAPTIEDNGDGSAHIETDIYKGVIYYKVVASADPEPAFVEAEWTQVDAEGNTAKQVAGDWKVYAVVKYPTSLTNKPAGVDIPAGVSAKAVSGLVGTNDRIITFVGGTEDILVGDEANHKYTVPSRFSIFSEGAKVAIGSDYKIPMNVYMVKAKPGKEDEPVRPYYRFAGWTADQDVTAMTRNDRPDGFDPLNPPTPIPDSYYPVEKKPAGTLLGTTTFVRMPQNDLTFTSQFYKNKVSLANASAPTLVTWDFTTDGVLYDRIDNGDKTYTEGPEYTQSHLGNDVWSSESMNVENDAFYYNRLAHVLDLDYPDEMNQLEFSYRYIDVPLFMDSRNVTNSRGQIFNVSFDNTSNASYATTTDRMIFGIPAVYGMQIKLIGNNSDGKVTTFTKENSQTTIGGEKVNAAEHKLLDNIQNSVDIKGGNPVLSMTYLGKGDYVYVDLNEGQAGGEVYMKGISVTYPARVRLTPQVKVGDVSTPAAGKIYYKPLGEEVEMAAAAVFSTNVPDTLIAKAAYGYKFVGWYDNSGTAIADGVTNGEKDANDNLLTSTLVIAPTASGNITAKFEAISTVKLAVTTYRNTPEEAKTPDEVSNAQTVSDAKGEYATFTFTTTHLDKTITLNAEYNSTTHKYEINVTPGTAVTILGTQIPGNRFQKWVTWDCAAATEVSTDNPYTVTVGAATTLYAQYEDATAGFNIQYAVNDEWGSMPMQTGVADFAVPRYYTVYREGYTIVGWTNTADTHYYIYNGEDESHSTALEGIVGAPALEPHATYVMRDDQTLAPVFVENHPYARLEGRKSETTIEWNLTMAQRAQLMNVPSNSVGRYTARTAVLARDDNYYTCDVPLVYSTGQRGRINNTTSNQWCTVGYGTTFTVPVTGGATVKMEVRSRISEADGGTRFNGEMPTLSKVKYVGGAGFVDYDPDNETAIESYLYTYTYRGNGTTMNIEIGDDYSFYRTISVTMPEVSVKREVELMNSDMTDWTKPVGEGGYGYAGGKLTTHNTDETLTLRFDSNVTANPNSTLAAGTQYVAGEKGYIQATNTGRSFTISGMSTLTRICYRQGAKIANGWRVDATYKEIVHNDETGLDEEVERTITLVADHKSTKPEWVEINDVYLKNPTITFTNISYLEKQQGIGNAYDAYIFNLQLYGIQETTNAQATLEVTDYAGKQGNDIIRGGDTFVTPYTLCLPTEVEQQQFLTAGVRPVPGLEHYTSYERMLQFDHGSEIKLEATPELGFEFVNWTDAEGNVLSTANPYIFNIYGDEKIQANYRRIGHIYYTFGSQNLEGALPAEQETAAGRFTVHANHSIAKQGGYTLTHWVNPSDPTDEKAALGVVQAQYVPGKTYTYSESDDHFTGYDVYLSPVMTEHSFSLLDIEDEKGVTVSWPFGYQGDAPELNIEQRAGFLIGQAFKGSDFIDLRLDIDARKQPNGKYGKVNNVGRTDNMAQVNANTVFTMPMTKGMKIELVADRSTVNTLAGGSKPTATGNTTTFRPTKTGQGEAAIGGNEVGSVVVYMNDNCNMSYIRATYYPRCKQPEITLSSVNTSGASVNVTSATSGATVYYTLDGSEPTAGSTKLTGNTISNITFTDGKPVTVKTIAISDSRPDSKVTTYVVSPYDVSKNTAVYLYNSADKAYDMANDVVYAEMLREYAGTYNVVAYDIRNGVPADANIASQTNDKVKAYVTSDADKSKATVVSTVGSKPVVTVQNVIAGADFEWDAGKTTFLVKNDKDMLAIFDKVLVAYDNRVCINNTDGHTLSDLNYNAAFLLTNATKAVLDDTYSVGDWLTETTTAPQVRNQAFSGNYVPAPELATLAGGEVDYPVNVWTNTITVGATVEGTGGYLDFVQPSTGSMDAIVRLYSDEEKTVLIRQYVVHLIVQTVTDELIYSSAKMNDEGTEWDNGTWSVSRTPGRVAGNDGECFKFNGSDTDVITITGPANYGIKSVTLHGYDYTGSYAGAGAASAFTATNEGGSNFTSQTSTLKKYQANEAVTKGDLTMDFPLGSTNTTSFKLTDGNQFVGTIIVEYYQRKPDVITLKESNITDGANISHNGTFMLTFDSQMAAVTEDAGAQIVTESGTLVQKLTAKAGESALKFRYWNLQPGNYVLRIPFAVLNDIYGTAFTGTKDPAVGKMTVDGSAFMIPFTVVPVVFQHKVFDFIVDDTDNGILWDGSHIKAINTFGDVKDDVRHVIYFPNRKDEKNRYFIGPNGTKFTDANSLTKLSADNLSFIGESRKYVVIANNPKTEGSSSTPTLQFEKTQHNYMQDLTIRDEYPYEASNFAGRATTLYDRGNYTILKNVSLESFQDTYYTGGMYGYNEDCRFSGVVDFIYGHGDYWFQHCDIIVRNRNGNNITAANTNDTERWGYVFMDCTIDKEEGATLVADGTFTLGRPWNGSPAVSWINTTMRVKPTNAGWQQMDTGFGKVLRLHEYNSMNPDGSPISLAGRSVAGMSPADGSYSAVMTAGQAAEYTLHNVLGGDTGYDPTEFTRQIGRLSNVYFDGHTLSWQENDSVLCYNVYYLGDGDEADAANPILIANITGHNYNINVETVFRTSQTFTEWYRAENDREFVSGWFAVRAANQRGGLNEMSNVVEYHEARTYTALVPAAGRAEGDDSGNVWSTIYLDFSAVVPYGTKAYALSAVTAYGQGDVTETTLVLDHVSANADTYDVQDVVLADQGYLLYGPAGEATFVETGRRDTRPSHLSGTIGRLKDGCPEQSPHFGDYANVPIGDVHAYTLATHTNTGEEYGLGFYQYSGTTLAHHKAYLDTDVANRLLGYNTSSTALLHKAMRVMIVEGTATRVLDIREGITTVAEGEVYTLSGQRILPSMMRKGVIYIIGGKKIRY